MSARSIDLFLDMMAAERGAARNTLDAYRRDITAFAGWLRERGSELTRARREDLMGYLAHRMGAGAKARSTARALSCLRSLYRYLLRENRVAVDPTLRIDNPKLGRPLPDSLTERQVVRAARSS